jgi:dihydrofolate synthase/folylpolyglutamate synthase
VLRERGAAIEPRHVVEGLAAARWPGRLEPCPTEPRLWWDGAHNPDGLDALARAWPLLGLEPPGGVVFACSSDKPAPAMLRRLARFAPGATLYATQSSSERTQPAEALADAARAAGLHADARPDLEDAVREALRRSRPPVLLCGSLFAVGDAMRATGCPPLEAV